MDENEEQLLKLKADAFQLRGQMDFLELKHQQIKNSYNGIVEKINTLEKKKKDDVKPAVQVLPET